MPAVSVFGAQWGDEGKGKIIDGMAAEADVVVRYQGGANAGHTVVVGGEKYVLHLIPSGILHPGKVNIVGNGVAVDPMVLLQELDDLAARGLVVEPDRLRLSEGAHVILDVHRRIDAGAERWRGKGRIGTTGRGIGPAYADKAARTGLRVADLLEPDRFRKRLTAALAEKNAILQRVYEEESFDLEATFARYSNVAERLAPFVANTGFELRRAHREGKRILFEGAQGVMLDIDHGTYPFVTSSSTGVNGIHSGAGFPTSWLEGAIGIAKAYCTRVGEGPFPSEDTGSDGLKLREVGQEYGATTGRPRRCGWFDAFQVRYALELNGATSWIVTNLDVLSAFDRIPVITGYRCGGRKLDAYPSDLEDVELVQETLPGWHDDITAVRDYAKLPAAARAYVERLEELVGLPVPMLSVGPERDQVIVRAPLWSSRG